MNYQYLTKEQEQQRALEEKWEKATLANNFIFYKVMRHHLDACKHLIEMLLKIEIEKMEMHNEEVIEIDFDSKGIRLDVFVKDKNKMYDIELQATDTKELPERSRYYQALMDLDTLKSGQTYKELKDSHIIFICLDDIFKKELPVYTFEYICEEDGKTKLNDRAIKHFFIAETCARMIEDEEIRSFFQFLISNKPSNGMFNFSKRARSNGLSLSNTPETIAFSSPCLIISEAALSPKSKPIQSMIKLLPAPVSPVRTVKPLLKSNSMSSIIAKF